MINKVINLIDGYTLIKANINEITFKIEELDDDYITSSEKTLDQKLNRTNNVISLPEKALLKREELIKNQNKLKRQLKRIDNALIILTDEEREIIQTVHIEHKKYYVVQDKLKLSYQRIKQIEKQAAKKMEQFVFSKEGLHG